MTAPPDLRDGYAFRASRRFPREPEIVVIDVRADAPARSFVGTARIDGALCNAFRIRREGRAAFYLFQTRF